MLNFFSDFPEEYNLSILQTIFKKAKKLDNGKWEPPVLTIIAKDLNTGEKLKTEIEDPDYEYFLVNNDGDIKINYHHFMIEKSKVNPIICKNSSLLKSIAENTGNIDFFNNNRNFGKWKDNQKLHTIKTVFFSDMNIEDHYRFWFSKKYKNEYREVTKGFIDIEVDVINILGDFPEPGEAPVSVITYIFNNKVHTYVYRESKNPLISDFENKWNNNELRLELSNLVSYVVGGDENLNKFNIANLNFDIKFFDKEIDLISEVFKDINKEKPDFVLAWNMAFDIPYLIARITALGYDPKTIICHPDFMHKSCYYYIDERSKDILEERGDYASISSYSVYLDQMITFASRRKGQKALSSYSLNDVGEALCNVKKLDYHDITLHIANLPYLDFKRYVFYNIVDVIVQICIESETNDIAYVYSSSLINNTRYSKVHRQLVYLNNKQASFYWDNGYIMGNNINKFKEKKKEKFKGAFVADPNLTSNRSKYKINKYYIMLFNLLIDYDFSALYPSIIREFNLGPTTQIGKIFIKNNGNLDDELGEEFIQDFITHDPLRIYSKWFDLPTFKEMADAVKELISTKTYKPRLKFEIYNNGVLEEFADYTNDKKLFKLPAFMFTYNKKNSPFLFNHKTTGYTELFFSKKELLENNEYY